MMELVSFLIMAVALPVVLSSLSNIGTGMDKDFFVKSTLISTFSANAIMLLIWLLFQSVITRYELLLVNALTSILLVSLCFPVYREKNVLIAQVLKSVCFCAVAIAVYSILTVGQIAIHGDTATASILTKCQLDHNSFFPASWYYVNGDIWVFSIQTFVAPFVILLNDQSLARTLGSALLVITTVMVMAYHSKKKFGTNCWVVSIPIMLIFLAGQRDMILYQAAYTSQMLYLICGCALFYELIRCPKNIIINFLFFSFSVISLMGGIRYLAEVTIPVWGGYVVLLYAELRNRESIDWKSVCANIFRLTFTVFISTAVGILIYWYLKHTHNVISSAHNAMVFVPSISRIIENFFVYISNYFACFGFQGGVSVFSIAGIMNIISMCMCLLIVFVVPILQACKINKESYYVKFFFSFTVVHNLVMFILSICFVNKDESRYLLTSIFLCILLSARYVYVYWIAQKHFDRFIWTGLFVFAVLFGSFSLLLNSRGWHGTLENLEEVTDQLAERGLKKGYADFWTAYGHEVYSDFEVRFGGLEIYEGTPYAHFWLVDGEVFNEQEIHTFLMLTEAENKAVSPKLSDLFRDPIDYMAVNGYHIYIFDYDIVIDLI